MLFKDGGSGASFISASEAVDAVSLLPGCSGEQADAPMPYAQAVLGAETLAETGVSLPKHAWPGRMERSWLFGPSLPTGIVSLLASYGRSIVGAALPCTTNGDWFSTGTQLGVLICALGTAGGVVRPR